MDMDLLEKIAEKAGTRELRARALDTVGSAKPSQTNHDAIILGYILQETGIKLSDETDNTIETELDEWDRDHLPHLARSLPVLTNSPADAAKLKFLIRHAVRQDFGDAVLNTSNPYGVYNNKMFEALTAAGFNASAWISSNQPVQYGKNTSHGYEQIFRFREWSRDFRKEFAVGNYSTCCIAVGDQTQSKKYAIRPQYQPILLDYFLDLAIKTIFINERISRDGQAHWLPLGQHYMFPAVDANSNERFLAITATELRFRDARPATGMVPALVSPFEGDNGLLKAFNASGLFVGQRFNEYTDFARNIHNSVEHLGMRMRTLRHDLSQANKKISRANLSDDTDEYSIQIMANKDLRHQLQEDIAGLDALAKGFYSSTKKPLRKVGLQESVAAGLKWFGTDYLDIFDIPPPHGYYGSDAYEGRRFTPSKIPKEVKGHIVYPGQIGTLIEHIDVVQSTYFPPKDKKRR